MPAPTPLTIATQAVNRLVKEEKYYQKELTQQTERVKKLEAQAADKSNDSDGNAEFVLKQERKALEETKMVFQPLNEKIAEAVSRLEEQVATAEGEGGSPAEEIAKAKEALSQGKAVGEPAAV
ncbi:tubulin folding cofactor A [Diatrype stigma]|uniref:Tubulin-specific chaperone A n=1 Tax=Diatrype stigma TaxID=117547 RepID=A0AAN9UBC4_9PEZI